MKVNRQNIIEDHGSSNKVDWFDNFCDGMKKSADYLDNIRDIAKRRKEFGSIDEKMADMKARAGFDLIKDVSDNTSTKVVTAHSSAAEECSCKRKSCKKCNPNIYRELISVINYIKDFAKDRKDVGLLSIKTHCREHPTLGFGRLEGLICGKKFDELALKIIGDKTSEEEVRYIPESHSHEEAEGDVAEYMSHAHTG